MTDDHIPDVLLEGAIWLGVILMILMEVRHAL